MGRFNFKRFSVSDEHCGMKIGTDAVLLGAWADFSGAATVLDAGCGSGVISLMAAQRTEHAEIIAVDVDENACRDASENFAASPWGGRIRLECADITKSIPAHSGPIVIISNPPFFIEQLRSPDAARSLARHGNGFDVKALIELSAPLLTSANDSLAFIAPAERDDEIDFMLQLHRLAPKRVCTVYSREGKKALRTLWQVGSDRFAGKHETDSLYIRDAENRFTKEYQALTSEFYL